MKKKDENRFYVYEHWRPDTDTCFWVGKGTGDRAYRFKRNVDYNNIVKMLAEAGMCVEVRLVQSKLTEFEALTVECERISFWRAAGIELTNRVDGGRGNRGMFVSDSTRELLRQANIGKTHSLETRAKMSKSHKGKGGGRPPGFKHSSETKEKIRASNIGKKRSDETKENVRLANIGKNHSEETRAKMSATHKKLGTRPPISKKGGLKSEETKAKISASLKKRNAKLRENSS